jgi:hypothetical protein
MTAPCYRSTCYEGSQVRVQIGGNVVSACLNHAESALAAQRESWPSKGPIETEKPAGLRKKKGRKNAPGN